MKLRNATADDLDAIWKVLSDAIERRKKEGSNQWQDGYPNHEIIRKDVAANAGFVLEDKKEIIAYICILINQEPAYKSIKGKWLTNNDFVVFHRIAVATKYLGKGYAQKVMEEVEKWAKSKQINSIKADTNFDNQQMLYLFKKLGYTRCGEIMMRESPRIAFEKILK